MKKFAILLFMAIFNSNAYAQLDPYVAAYDEQNPSAPILLDAIKSNYSVDRFRAAVALGRILKPESALPLIHLSHDVFLEVREAAVFGLGQLSQKPEWCGAHQEAIRTALLDRLQDPSPFVRLRAIEGLGKTQSPLNSLESSLRSISPEIRAEALLAIARHLNEMIPQNLIGILKNMAFDGSPDVRRALSYALSRTKDMRMESTALQLAKETDSLTRFFALKALTRVKSRYASQAFSAVTSPQWNLALRLQGIQGLGEIGIPQWIPPSSARDPSFHIRLAFLEAWSKHPETTHGFFESFLGDPSPTVRTMAHREFVLRSKQQGIPRLTEMQKHSDWRLREAAAQIAGQIDPQLFDPVGFTNKSLEDQDARVRIAALETLSKFSEPSAYAAIEGKLVSPTIGERSTAVNALSKRTESARFKAAWNCYQASSGPIWEELREMLVSIFDSEVTPETTDYLGKIVHDSTRGVALAARTALQKRGVTDFPSLPPQTYVTSPHRNKKFNFDPIIEIKTHRGVMRFQLFSKEAPIHVAHLVGNIQNGFYDGLEWHRVVSNFVVQGGDPEGSGWGGDALNLRAEIGPRRFVTGSLGMPRSTGIHTGNVQMFVSLVPSPHLDGLYTLMGQLVEGWDTLYRLERGDVILQARVL